ncbi:hypothetical protein SCP_1002260 [Sparassis crispa]|uniref:Uncharacterized protein n=1 Tax=Sparassis crispa TaxID=139825 RepID=A0A401GXS2_9APHY|nr:hypothetical protein SCP_1002260 [Sparassis crispa]GBE86980.1 hypothetical protein SCP_1002260 [Sparassis crispa]
MINTIGPIIRMINMLIEANTALTLIRRSAIRPSRSRGSAMAAFLKATLRLLTMNLTSRNSFSV